jgi:hypothetical protein
MARARDGQGNYELSLVIPCCGRKEGRSRKNKRGNHKDLDATMKGLLLAKSGRS